ncbi:MAG TPA: hypothetical protein VMU37_03315 [Caulobacteraceae bacterium]|nr:hypothetical protein [Caulobacteraceae bacterium]
MAEQSPRSLVNIVFIVLLLAALGVVGLLAVDMLQNAATGPG